MSIVLMCKAFQRGCPREGPLDNTHKAAGVCSDDCARIISQLPAPPQRAPKTPTPGLLVQALRDAVSDTGWALSLFTPTAPPSLPPTHTYTSALTHTSALTLNTGNYMGEEAP